MGSLYNPFKCRSHIFTIHALGHQYVCGRLSLCQCFKSNATIIEVMQHAKPFYSASAQGFRSPEWDFVIISILRLTMWNSWAHVFQATVLLYSIVSCQPFVWLRIGSCKLFLHCPSIEWNHPTSASVSPPSCWTSMSISIDTHCKYIKDL